MPEQRARKYHQDRVAETLRDEIGAMIEGELSDPRISFAYISQVVLNPGGKSALIYVAVDGGPEEEKQTIADDIKDVYAEAKATGYDTKIMKQVIRIRKQDKAEREEQEALLDLYLSALGMIFMSSGGEN